MKNNQEPNCDKEKYLNRKNKNEGRKGYDEWVKTKFPYDLYIPNLPQVSP